MSAFDGEIGVVGKSNVYIDVVEEYNRCSESVNI